MRTFLLGHAEVKPEYVELFKDIIELRKTWKDFSLETNELLLRTAAMFLDNDQRNQNIFHGKKGSPIGQFPWVDMVEGWDGNSLYFSSWYRHESEATLKSFVTILAYATESFTLNVWNEEEDDDDDESANEGDRPSMSGRRIEFTPDSELTQSCITWVELSSFMFQP
jgi:hypothetical protein